MKLNGVKDFLSQFDSTETKRAYKRDIIQFFEFSKTDPKKITRLHFMKFIEFMKKNNKSNSTISRIVYALKSFFRFLYSVSYVETPNEKIFDSLRIPTPVRRNEEDLSDDEVKKIIKKANSTVEKLILRLMLYNGLRRSEVVKIKFGDVVKNGNKISLTVLGKGGKSRTIPLHSVCWSTLVAYLKETQRTGPQLEDSRLLITPSGKHFSGQDVYVLVRQCAKDAGIERIIHPHMFRAKFCSMALESGVPITSVQADLGHSSIQTTSMYDHAKNKYERSSIIKIKSIEEDEEKKKVSLVE